MSKIFSPHLQAAHEQWKAHLKPFDTALDLTCGNGRDTAFLSDCVPNGRVLALDIQLDAIERTRLQLAGRSNVELHCLSHAEIDRIALPSAPRLAVYNLGYLPGGDKSVTTRVESTLQSLEKVLQLIAADGAVSITCYPGHEEGAKEEEALLAFVAELSSLDWTVCHRRWVNRPRSPSWLFLSKQTG